MADDIEASAGFDPKAPRTDNELLVNETFKESTALRYLQFFGSRNPTDEEMYTPRAMLASDITKQQKLTQSAVLR
eukprot:12143846-Heterocapsa_arctica.AAC.1